MSTRSSISIQIVPFFDFVYRKRSILLDSLNKNASNFLFLHTVQTKSDLKDCLFYTAGIFFRSRIWPINQVGIAFIYCNTCKCIFRLILGQTKDQPKKDPEWNHLNRPDGISPTTSNVKREQ